jgi:integrase
MALYKRGKAWHTDFAVNGQRFRQSLETTDWREAQAKEKRLIAQASEGKVSFSTQQFARLPFAEALERHLRDRAVRVCHRSHVTESAHSKPLLEHFGATLLARIVAGPEPILSYIRKRKEAGISNTTVNMEIGILRRVLKRAKLWHLVEADVKRLPERHDIGRAIPADAKMRLLRVAASRPEWETAYLASVLAFNTTMRGCEIRGLRWQDVDLMSHTVVIRRAKTEAGDRVIPLNQDAMEVALRLRERAQSLLGTDLLPAWYVFPHAEGHTKPDPTKPMSSWRSAWRKIRNAAGLAGLRFHDLRHQAITELAESQASDQTIMSIAGHVSPSMLAHYSHVRLEAKRHALDALSSGRSLTSEASGKARSYDTKHVTKLGSERGEQSEVIENMVSAAGFEPATHALKGHCSTS